MNILEVPAVSLPMEADELRRQVRDFLTNELQAGRIESNCDCWLSGFSADFSKRLGDMGWIGMTWPAEYGGHERSSLERYTVIEELLAFGAPVAGHWIADRQSGPLLLKYGTEEQKRHFLPRIAKGECFFCIGLSEPNAGSDLAAIQTRATKTKGGWILNGSKIWTSGAHFSHYMIALCRTDDLDTQNRHAGMSQMIVDLSSDGVTIRPILLMTGEHHFNEVFFDDVFIPDNRLIGLEGEGWVQSMAELAYERSGPERFLSTYPLLNELTNFLLEKEEHEGLLVISRLTARLWSLRNLSIGIADQLDKDVPSDISAALVKDMGTQFEQEIADLAREYTSVIPSVQSSDRLSRLLAESILQSPGFTLRGGTTEILRGIIAKGVFKA
ncbi:acyl-CoA dehydrogenase family protein [Pradoshia eiseniae]|nr:acyl-CoA dehydrogenase family protein [Pradoshia eiseniae]